MHTCIALFRGINVGGRNILPMKELVRDLEALGLQNVRTYIQSGNVVFQSPRKLPATFAEKIAMKIEKGHGFKPRVVVLDEADLQRAIDANPFPGARESPKTLNLFFLAAAPATPDLASLDAARSPTEEFELIDRVFYLHTPDGFGTSKLAERVERSLGVPATARNWRTVLKLAEMAGA